MEEVVVVDGWMAGWLMPLLNPYIFTNHHGTERGGASKIAS